jgi:hypothetical protein
MPEVHNIGMTIMSELVRSNPEELKKAVIEIIKENKDEIKNILNE